MSGFLKWVFIKKLYHWGVWCDYDFNNGNYQASRTRDASHIRMPFIELYLFLGKKSICWIKKEPTARKIWAVGVSVVLYVRLYDLFCVTIERQWTDIALKPVLSCSLLRQKWRQAVHTQKDGGSIMQ